MSSSKEERTIGGVFRIVRRLRSGGMGVVYEAVHTGTAKRCAVKVIALPTHPNVLDPAGQDSLSDFTASAYKEAIRRFEREVRAANAVVSPHIVRVIDAGYDTKTNAPYIVMELLEGEDLQATLKERPRLASDLAVRIAAQACAGLEKAHGVGVIHRDIKPGNLFLSDADNGSVVVKILDFGIAKIKLPDDGAPSGDLTRTGSILGSLHYMSPEQIKGSKNIDQRTDIWSLGVVLYQMLVGTTPFTNAETAGETMLAICTRPPDDVREHAPEVSAELGAIVMRALQMDPARRFATVEAFRVELEKLVSHGLHITRDELPRSARVDARRDSPVPRPQAARDFELEDEGSAGLVTPEAWAPDLPPERVVSTPRSLRGALAVGSLVLGIGTIAFFTTRESPATGAIDPPAPPPNIEARQLGPNPRDATAPGSTPVDASTGAAPATPALAAASSSAAVRAGSATKKPPGSQKIAKTQETATEITSPSAAPAPGGQLPDFGGRR